MAVESTARKQLVEAGTPFRAAPHNIEVEQALLGAILVNNDAFYRVSDFLTPEHFFDGIHQKVFEIASNLIRAGKTATPITIKTFLPLDLDIGGMTSAQYLARLAAKQDGDRLAWDLQWQQGLLFVNNVPVPIR